MTTNTNKYFTHKEHYLAFRSFWAQAVNSKEIEMTGAHHMLYNILRGKAYDNGFAPNIRTSKLQNGHFINQGLRQAYMDLKGMIDSIGNERNWHNGWLKTMLSIFQGSVTEDMLKMIELPEVGIMMPDYGPYKRVAEFIVNMRFEDRPTTFAEIQAILEITQTEAA